MKVKKKKKKKKMEMKTNEYEDEGVSSLGNIEYDNADIFGDEKDSEYDDDNEEFKPDEVDSLYLA